MVPRAPRRRRGRMAGSLERELEALVSTMGFELVSMERAGGRRRPLLRLRVDRPDSRPGQSFVTVDDCAAVSREVSRFLEERGTGEGAWILEVSSPGVNRPLTKARDYKRFAGETVRLRGFGRLLGESKQVEGLLIGLEEEGGREVVVMEVDGDRKAIALSDIARATLVYEFGA